MRLGYLYCFQGRQEGRFYKSGYYTTGRDGWIVPHADVQRALDAAMLLDIPFWPPLPNFSCYEDMCVQASDSGSTSWTTANGRFYLEKVRHVLRAKGVDSGLLLSRSLLSPATRGLVNPDREKTVEKAFGQIRRISRLMREHNRIGP